MNLFLILGKEGGCTDDETHKDKRSEETEVFREVEQDGEWWYWRNLHRGKLSKLAALDIRYAPGTRLRCLSWGNHGSARPAFFESKAEFARSLGKHPCEIASWLSVRKDDLFAVDLYGSDNAIVIAWNNRE